MDYTILLKEIPKDVLLVAVTKNRQLEDIQYLYKQGCRDFGENRLQEALPKIAQLPSDIKWHLIGPLQKNKVRKAVGRFALIHSVDTLELAQKISSVSQEMDCVTSILLQVNTSGEFSKQGMTGEDCLTQFEKYLSLPSIQIKGLMTMAPLDAEENVVRNTFAKLQELKEKINQTFSVKLTQLSMGMSQDYKIAVDEGSTIVRIGSLLYKNVN